MDQFNLLDLNNDVLNIIGDYVKQDNHDKMRKERVKQLLKKDLFNYVDYEVEKLRKTNKKKYIHRGDLRACISLFFGYFLTNHLDEADYIRYNFDEYNEMIEEYLTLKKLNLKRK